MTHVILPELLSELNLKISSKEAFLLEQLVDELLRWNPRRNLTAITDHDEVLEKHLVDSLTLLPFARQSDRLLDIGSGAGFPALPLKIVCPELEVVSVDAVGKKIDFQRHAVRTLGLTGFTALHERVEKLVGHADYRAGFDLVTARALCSLGDLVALAGPFLAPGGRLVAMKGPEGHLEFSEQRDLLSQKGWAATLHGLKLPVSGAERCLIELTL
ncbi:MAG: 16S rRNA (guanine(527)-N(7))-methyltransferase RsmG [Deltaproteobacteria bacterium]|nr:MAG: 16S rRNA (guanine(527)-N(7))-methyltransferase RsmG [Deltaproteobacteria bacterium]